MIAHLLALLHIAAPAWAADADKTVSGLPSWAPWLIGVVILPIVWPWIKKAVASSISADFLKAVKAALDEGDEDDDVLILAFVRWVKVKSTKLGAKGSDAYTVIAKWICSRVKLLAGREALVAELAETCVESVRDTAVEIEQGAKADNLYTLELIRVKVSAIQAKIEAGGANENLTAATVMCSDLISAISPHLPPPPTPPIAP